MISIQQQKSQRRARLAELLKEIKPAELVERLHATGTPISAAMLYQMSTGKGKSLRNANDAQSRAIEQAAGKVKGWLDGSSGYEASQYITNEVREDDSENPIPGSVGWLAKLTLTQSSLRRTLDFYLPLMDEMQADALRQMILALRLSKSQVD